MRINRIDAPPHVAHVVDFFESLTLAGTAGIRAIYAADAWFKDPFNEVRGADRIQAIFIHMFGQVDAPRFVVREALVEGQAAVLIWEFHFGFRRPLPRGARVIRGCSHLRFTTDGRIDYHRDYWDAAEELYEKIPVLGGLMRLLRRKGGTAG
jgi:steroid Delta-isomerase